jgi:hypothetical protein
MHIPKAARLTLKHLFKFDDAFFEALEGIDIDKLQKGVTDLVQNAQEQFPLLTQRVETMENNISIVRTQQRTIVLLLEEIADGLNVKDGGIPRELPSAEDFPGREDVIHALEAQSQELPNV